jgi:RHS repeat-associated protein
LEETLDYYPYGGIRVDDTTGIFEQKNKYTGQDYDESTGLNYLGNRYQNGSIGKFISQDPVFQAVGSGAEVQARTGLKLQQYLSDPQGMNSYSYARNNPMKLVDKSGDYFETAFDVAMFSLSLNDFRQNPGLGTGLGLAADAVSLVTPIPAIVGGIRHGDDALKLLNKADVMKDANNLSNGLSVCRGGGCTAENFLKGSNEYKSGLNPSLSDPLSGISVNVGENLSDLLKSGNLLKYGQFGESTVGKILNSGGKITPDINNNTNPFHANIEGLNAQQLQKIFNPTQKNPFKIKK